MNQHKQKMIVAPVLRAVAYAAASLTVSLAARASTVEWVDASAGPSFWDIGSNWSSTAAPANLDDVRLALLGSREIFYRKGDNSINSLLIEQGNTLSFQAGALATSFLDNRSVINLMAGGPAALRVVGGYSGEINLNGWDARLELSGVLQATGQIALRSGTLSGGTVVQSGGNGLVFSHYGGMLDGLTVHGALNLGDIADPYLARVRVSNGLTLRGEDGVSPGVLNLGIWEEPLRGGAILTFSGSQTLDHATLNMNGPYAIASLQGNASLTLGPDLLLQGAGTLGRNPFEWGDGSKNNLINEGVIKANRPGTSLTVNPSGELVNKGIMQAETGAALYLLPEGGLQNSGSIIADGGAVYLQGSVLNGGLLEARNGGLLSLDPSRLSGLGQARVADALSTLDLTGSFETAHIAKVDNSVGGRLTLSGVMNNAASSLNLADIGAMQLTGGLVVGGSILQSVGRTLNFSSRGGRLDAVTVHGDLNLVQWGERLDIINGLTLLSADGYGPGLLNVDVSRWSPGGLSFMGTQTLDRLTINLGRANWRDGVVSLDGGGTLTLGKDALLQGSGVFGEQRYESGRNDLINAGTIRGERIDGFSDLTINNNGSLLNTGLIESNDGWLALNPAEGVNNAGMIRAANHARLEINASLINSGSLIIGQNSFVSLNGPLNNSGIVSAQGQYAGVYLTGSVSNAGLLEAREGGQLGLDIGRLSNSGHILIADGASSVLLGGSFTRQQLLDAAIDNQAGARMYLTGALDNSVGAGRLNLNLLGPLQLQGGQVRGGVIQQAGSGQLTTSGAWATGASTFDAVTVWGELNVVDLGRGQGAKLRISNGLSLLSEDGLTPGAVNVGRLHDSSNQPGEDVLGFTGTQTLDKARLLLGNASWAGTPYEAKVSMDGGGTLTLGAEMRVQGSGSFGASVFDPAGLNDLVNYGTISANRRLLTLNNSGSFANFGVLEVAAGAILSIQSGGGIIGGIGTVIGEGTLDIAGSYTNQVGAQLQMNGINLGAAQLSNAGLITGYGSLNAAIANSGQIVAGMGSGSGLLKESTSRRSALGSSFANSAASPSANEPPAPMLSLLGGVQGPAGSLLIEPGARMLLAAPSSAGQLNHQGELLQLDADITIHRDYSNSHFGLGNAFDRRAGVAGAGQILAAGSARLIVVGDRIEAGETDSPILHLPAVRLGHGGSSASFAIQHGGNDGPTLRGALQTSGITQEGLAGSGVSAQNWILPTPGSSSQEFSVRFNPLSSGTLLGQSLGIVSNFDNVPGQTLLISARAYAPALAVLESSSLNFGIVRVGEVVTRSLKVSNTASGNLTDSLRASFGNAGGSAGVFVAAGNADAVGAGSSDSSSLMVSVDTSSAGLFTGQAGLALSSRNAEMADLDLGSRDISFVAQINRIAAARFDKLDGGAVLSGSGLQYWLDFGSVKQGGAAATAWLVLSNGVTGTADELAGYFEADTGQPGVSGFSWTGLEAFSGLHAGAALNALQFRFDTSTLGQQEQLIRLRGFSTNVSDPSGLALADIELHLTGNVAAVPEPSSVMLMLMGLFCLAGTGRRRAARQ
ncbi:choice-of-anchor D domain-containing protein [Roseateles albus]|uniref:Choice-of-anchor D domain-containing protein n=1 Tax=Roseateles albus TaxID=2987525 RepID=A0ABT5KHH3_9BURK|nr:choice-of-anchor D domain-containing protein [Roseateles albus]MDC8772410.1 choice-of-anchor D domain-containing protein [Roseateles albus]